jgi:protein TonB
MKANYRRCYNQPMQKLKLVLLLALFLQLAGFAQAGQRPSKKPAAQARPAVAVVPFTPKFARDEQPPQAVSMEICPRPDYPKPSLRNEETGTVSMQFKIAANGVLLETKLWRSSGFRDLDRSALNAMSRCKFRPATLDGKPVQGYAYIAYVFTLD